MTYLDHPSWQCVTPEGWADLGYMAESFRSPHMVDDPPPRTQRILIVTWKSRIELEIDRLGRIVDAPGPLAWLVGSNYEWWLAWAKRQGGLRISTREQEGL